MAQVAVILDLVGLTVMANAYSMRQPHFDQGLQTEKQDGRAQLMEHLPGIATSNGIWSYTHMLLYTLAFSSSADIQEDLAGVDVSTHIFV